MAATLAYLSSQTTGTDQTVYTFSGVSLGLAASDRVILVIFSSRSAISAFTISSVTIGGETATSVVEVANNTGGFARSGMFLAEVPTGTTGDIVVTLSNGQVRAACEVYRATGMSLTPVSTGSDTTNTFSASLDVPADGFALGGGQVFGHSGGATWTNLTERSENTVESVMLATSAGDEFGTTQTGLAVSCAISGTLNSPTMVFASFGPTAAAFQSAWARGSNVMLGMA